MTSNLTLLSIANTTEEQDGSMLGAYSLPEAIFIAIIAGFLSLLTVAGNCMVMISFKIDKQLQTISNYFLFSLAVADFVIGLISMPLFTIYLLSGKWTFGPHVCDGWLALDYLASNASVLNLLIISFDRYFSVTRPLTYRARRTPRRAGVMIASAWLISLVLWPPWIYSWPYIEGERTVPETECYIQFIETNNYVTFGTAIAAFYVPVTVMCILYWQIWRETEKRQKDLSNLQAGKRPDSKRSNSSGDETPLDIEEWKRCRNKASNPNLRGIDDASETTYVPTSAYLKGNRKYSVQYGRRLTRLDRLRICGWQICQFFGRNYENESDEISAATPASMDTNFPSSVSRCTSLNFVRAGTPTGNTGGKRTWDKSHLFRSNICESAVTHAAENPPLSRSQSTESVFTIVIKLPEEESNRPSIIMLPDIAQKSRSQPSLFPSSAKEDMKPRGSFHGRPFQPSVTPLEQKRSSATPFSTNSWSRKPKTPLRQTISSISGTVSLKPNSLPLVPPSNVYFSPWVPRSCMPVAQSPLIAPKNAANRSNEQRILKQSSDSPSENSLPLNTKIIPKLLARPNCSNKSPISNANTPGRRLPTAPLIVQNQQKKQKKTKKKNQEKKQDRKAAKTLSAILLAFILTWTPYNILVLIKALVHCEDSKCFPDELWSFSYYLCYINSTINPVCYALCNASFRRTYVRILSCKWHQRTKTAVQRGFYN